MKTGAIGKQAGGFTLVEIAISLAIFGFAMVAMLGLVPIGVDTVRSSKQNLVLSEIIQSVTNTAQQTNYSLLSSLNTTFYFDQDGLTVPASSSTTAIYQAAVSGSANAALPATTGTLPTLPGLATVHITVSRVSPAGANPSSYTVYIANQGN